MLLALTKQQSRQQSELGTSLSQVSPKYEKLNINRYYGTGFIYLKCDDDTTVLSVQHFITMQ